MKKYTQAEIDELIEKHKIFIYATEEEKHKYIENRLVLSDADLSNLCFERADLRRASFTNVKFTNANLERAKLKESYLSNVKFTNARFLYADLRKAYLIDINMKNADLRGVKWDKSRTVNVVVSCAKRGDKRYGRMGGVYTEYY